MRFANGMRSNQFEDNLSRRRAVCGRAHRAEREALMISSTELTYTGVLARGFCQSNLPAGSVCRFADGRGRSLGPRENAARRDRSRWLSLGCLARDAIWFWLGRQWGSNAMHAALPLQLPTREVAPGMRATSSAVMVSGFCASPSLFPAWTASCRRLPARKECRSRVSLLAIR